MESTLILLRHGQSTWNLENRFTGWWDAPLTEEGRAEAAAAGRAIRECGLPISVAHTSVLTRAIDTCNMALTETERNWIPLRKHWRLNERHYGELTGKNKSETAERYGDEQVRLWRRSYKTAPPPVTSANPWNPNADPRFADIAPQAMPAGEALRDVLGRLLPYWYDRLVPDLKRFSCVLIAAHGNSLRALVKHLDGVADEDISEVEIPTGKPILYTIGVDLLPSEKLPLAKRFL